VEADVLKRIFKHLLGFDIGMMIDPNGGGG